jgi:RNA polymerase sigma-70 factor (ECF subfamily)
VIDSGRKLLIELLAETDEVREIHEAISTLDDDHRPVIELHFFEELHLDVIAERMGIPLGTVKSRMSRAKILLRDRIHEEHLVSQF